MRARSDRGENILYVAVGSWLIKTGWGGGNMLFFYRRQSSLRILLPIGDANPGLKILIGLSVLTYITDTRILRHRGFRRLVLTFESPIYV